MFKKLYRIVLILSVFALILPGCAGKPTQETAVDTTNVTQTNQATQSKEASASNTAYITTEPAITEEALTEGPSDTQNATQKASQTPGGTTPAPSSQASTSAPSPSAAAKDTALRPGDKGDSVKNLQQRLVELKYLKRASGEYDDDTEEAVKEFQKRNDIKVTGIADKDTMEKLFSEDAKQARLPLEGYVIGIDPGHQEKANHDKEPIAPGSDETKSKTSSGTEGIYTKVPEYKVDLEIGLRLRTLLEGQGAKVVMTRETNDVDISNIERAQIFNKNKTDYAIRLHCNGSDDTSKHGAFVLIPEKHTYKKECRRAAELLIDEFCAATGASNLGVVERDEQTAFNWCERMIINIEMGHMSNKEEDIKLTDPDYQKKMARGILNGILKYFE